MASGAIGDTGGEMSEDNKALARRFFEEVYSQGKVELVEELMAADYVAQGAGTYTTGLEAVKRSILNKPPSIDVKVEEQIAEGDKVVSRLAFSADGESWVGVAIQHIVDGKIAETWRITNSPTTRK